MTIPVRPARSYLRAAFAGAAASLLGACSQATGGMAEPLTIAPTLPPLSQTEEAAPPVPLPAPLFRHISEQNPEGYAARRAAIAAAAKPDFMALAGPSAPIAGHVDFCNRHPEDCAHTTSAPALIRYNATNRALLRAINDEVNQSIIPITDQELHGVPDYWSYPVNGQGDCEDYALEKRKRLIAAGLPESALLIAVVWDANNEGHALLLARTDEGDFLLDNLIAAVRIWHDAPYRWVKTQSPYNAREWVNVAAPS